jgi:hypothetical protein
LNPATHSTGDALTRTGRSRSAVRVRRPSLYVLLATAGCAWGSRDAMTLKNPGKRLRRP